MSSSDAPSPTQEHEAQSVSHTPGPWSVCPATTNYIAVRAANGHIARMAITRDSVRRAEGQANARLIAAAPELLEALRDLVLYHDVPAQAQDPVVLPLLKAAFVSIAKAEGRS